MLIIRLELTSVVTSLIVLICLWSCTFRHELAGGQLRFDDVEKLQLQKRHIAQSVITYDTSSLKRAALKTTNEDIESFVKFCKEGIGTSTITYDINGNIVSVVTKEFMGTTEHFKYDSLQRVIYKEYITDFTASYYIHYYFDRTHSILYQFWTYGDNTDTTVYRFDETGRVVKENGHLHDDKSTGRTYTKDYYYQHDTLRSISTSYHSDYHYLARTEDSLFYRKGIISRREVFFYYSQPSEDRFPLPVKTLKEFDEGGLPLKLIVKYHTGVSTLMNISNK